jgi:thiosulfate/3-mercaptopyruvate sulfurtransferase
VPVSDAPPLAGPLVDADWLHDHLAEVRVVDVRWYLDGRSGLEAYRGGHIPGAVFADLDTDLSGPPGVLGRHPLPAPEQFAAVLARLGIAHDSTVVAYDDASGSIAARLWWMLDAIGVRAAVLDGGIAAWRHGLTTDVPVVAPARFEPRLWPEERFADAGEVDRLRRDPAAVLLDVRSEGRFRGEERSIDVRPGHIPGARSAPWQGNVDQETGRLRSPATLRDRFAALGAEGRHVVTMCGSGVTACQTLLALRLAGIDDAALYTGSYSGWTADPARPVAGGGE